jgi:predicted nuclease of predicted toxin-antitoxin system
VKLLIDMNLSPLWSEVLESAGFAAVHWSSVGDVRATDEELFRWARANNAVVFTHDLDFSRMLALTGEDGPSVVQLRTHDLLPRTVGDLVLSALRQHEELLSRGALVVIDADSARTRILPIRGG